MRDGKKRNEATFGLNHHDIAVENRAGRAHPGTQQGPVGRRLMLGMMSGMFRRLRLRQSADGEQAENQNNREDFSEGTDHRNTSQRNSGSDGYATDTTATTRVNTRGLG
jgi:hypothetical protein